MTSQLHIYSGSLLERDRSELVDDLEDWLGNVGEVIGAGSGRSGWNIDVELEDGQDVEVWAPRLAAFLQGWGVPRDTYFRVFPPDWMEGTEGHRVQVFGP